MRRSFIHCMIPMLLLAFFCCGWVGAQEKGSLYIQSENNQVFYVQCNGAVLVSSATGYLMVPKMPAGEYAVVIGFPRNRYGDYLFTCNVDEKPKAYSLKLAIDNSWSLFDMVGFGSIKGRLATEAEKSLLKPEILKKEEAGQAFVATDFLNKNTGAGVQKIFDQTTEAGIDQIYVVNNDGKMDTVMVLISFLPEGNTGAANTRKPELPQALPFMVGTLMVGLPLMAGEILPAKAPKLAAKAQSSK